MSGNEEHDRATTEARQHVTGRPVTAPSHEAGIAGYLAAQHYREQRVHRDETKSGAPADAETGAAADDDADQHDADQQDSELQPE